MKKLFLSTSFLVLSSAAVMAADLPMQSKAPVLAAPAFSWTGCYVGAQVGGGMMTNTEGSGNNGKGGLAGGQAGCNYQDGNWVFGVEGEGYWSGIRATQSGSNIPNIVNNSTFNSFTSTTNNNNDFSIAARAGITFDRTLIYGKGGWAWGAFKTSSIDICCGVGPTTTTTAQSGTLDGFLVGVGIEHALTRNWTVKLEYNFIAFGAKELSTTECRTNVCGEIGTSTISATKQVFKVGANYLFDIGGAPLVARY
jgi:outer membrane immunogenic protein